MRARVIVERTPNQPDVICMEMRTIVGGRCLSQAETIPASLAAALRIDLWGVICDWMRRAELEILNTAYPPHACPQELRRFYDGFARMCADCANKLNRGEAAVCGCILSGPRITC